MERETKTFTELNLRTTVRLFAWKFYLSHTNLCCGFCPQQIGDMSSDILVVAALGRPFTLGTLYDARQDKLIPGNLQNHFKKLLNYFNSVTKIEI